MYLLYNEHMGARQSSPLGASPFDGLGLPYDRLQALRFAILWYSIEEQAKAADHVCKSMASSSVFIGQQRVRLDTSGDDCIAARSTASSTSRRTRPWCIASRTSIPDSTQTISKPVWRLAISCNLVICNLPI